MQLPLLTHLSSRNDSVAHYHWIAHFYTIKRTIIASSASIFACLLFEIILSWFVSVWSMIYYLIVSKGIILYVIWIDFKIRNREYLNLLALNINVSFLPTSLYDLLHFIFFITMSFFGFSHFFVPSVDASLLKHTT